MPCWTISNVECSLKVADWEILKKAIIRKFGRVNESGKQLYLYVNGQPVTIQPGKITVREGEEGVVTTIKKAYAEEVVREASSRLRWPLKPGKTANQFELLKRY